MGCSGPDSVTWRVMGEPILLVGGFRALLMQGLHPRAMRGVAAELRADGSGRGLVPLRAGPPSSSACGPTARGPRSPGPGRRVRKIHATLTALDPDTGERFRLDDPDALRWVHVGEVDSYLSVARRAGVRLTDDEADRFVAEWRRAAEVVGLRPGRRAPLGGRDARLHRGPTGPASASPPRRPTRCRQSFNAPLPLLPHPAQAGVPRAHPAGVRDPAALGSQGCTACPPRRSATCGRRPRLRALHTGLGLFPAGQVRPGRPQGKAGDGRAGRLARPPHPPAGRSGASDARFGSSDVTARA